MAKTQPCTMTANYLICPICNRGKIISEDGDAHDNAICLIPPGNRQKTQWHVKCNVCKSQIGIAFK